MLNLHREQIREAVTRGDIPPYAVRAYIEAALVDARNPKNTLNPDLEVSDALQFAADLSRSLVHPFDLLDYIPVPDGIREAL